MKNLSLFVILIFAVNISFSQPTYPRTEDFYPNREAIILHKIQSVKVFVEMSEDDIRERGSISGKLVEAEFNALGRTIYRLTSDNHGNEPFVYYGRGSFLEMNKFDSEGRIIWAFTQNEYRSEEDYTVYDDDHIVQFEHISSEDTIIRVKFNWKKNKMVNSEITYANESNEDRYLIHDEEGRVIKSGSSTFRFEFEYSEIADTLILLKKVYKNDTLYYSEKDWINKEFDRVVRYEKRNDNNELVIEMSADLDEYGNATELYMHLYDERERKRRKYVEWRYRIENSYDERELLVRRSFFYGGEDDPEILNKIEHYFYDTAPLTFKLERWIEEDEIYDSID